MRSTLLLAFIVLTLQLFSQADSLQEVKAPYSEVATWPEEFSVRFDLGVGMMSNSFADDIENLTVANGAAGNIGLVWLHHYESPMLFRMELTIMNVQSIETMKAFSFKTESGVDIFYENGEVRKSATYLTLPILIGLEFSRFYLSAGIQGGMIMSGSQYTVNQVNDGPKKLDEKVYKDFDAGFRAMVGFRFAKHLYAEASYYHGLGNVCSGQADTVGQTWKIKQATFGIRYSFHYYKPEPYVDLFDIENME